jgi:DNA-binding MarR family transcriptional regulator
MAKMPEAPETLIDPFEGLLGYHLRRLSALTMADLNASLAPLSLKPAEASILFVVAANPRVTQSDVGRALGILRANMTPMVAALMTEGLIEREPVDGRSQALRLTAAGQLIARKAMSATRLHEERLFGTLPRAARERLITQLTALWQK